MRIQNKTSFIKSEENQNLFIQSWTAPKADKVLIITHGLGEHSQAYENFAKSLLKKIPMKIYAWDMTGHGRSDGQRGYVGDIEWLLNDLKTVIQHVEKTEELKPHLFSHSLGGLLTLSALTKKIIKAPASLCLSNPCIELKMEVPKWKKKGAEFLSVLAPKLTLDNEIKPNQLSSDLEYQKEVKLDPYRHHKISSKLYLGMMDLMQKLDAYGFPKNLDSLTMLSLNDPICNYQETELFFKQIENCQLEFFDDSLHEIIQDKQKDIALIKYSEFLNKR